MTEPIPHETIREQLRQPFAAHETWWHRVAEQLLDETECLNDMLCEYIDDD